MSICRVAFANNPNHTLGYLGSGGVDNGWVVVTDKASAHQISFAHRDTGNLPAMGPRTALYLKSSGNGRRDWYAGRGSGNNAVWVYFSNVYVRAEYIKIEPAESTRGPCSVMLENGDYLCKPDSGKWETCWLDKNNSSSKLLLTLED